MRKYKTQIFKCVKHNAYTRLYWLEPTNPVCPFCKEYATPGKDHKPTVVMEEFNAEI